MTAYSVISADSHVFEPRDLWEQYIDPSYRDRAPRVVRQKDQDVLLVDGIDTEFVGIMGSAGVESEKLRDVQAHDEARRGGWDPHARVGDMDRDGVDAEVLYASLGMRMHAIQEPDYQLACFRAYNDWVADFCAAYPLRLIGVGLVPMMSVGTGVEEMRRFARKGLRGAAVSIDLGGGPQAFWAPEYDVFWAAAVEMEMPVSLHLGTVGVRERRSDVGDFIGHYAILPTQLQLSIANLIAYGVFERFPELKLISVENDLGWVPTYLARIDHAYERYPHWTGARLPMMPSEYFRRQVYPTFISDRPGVEMRHHIGVDKILWSSDYPHPDSTWPRSRESIEWQMAGLPEEELRKIVCDNAARLYHLP